MLITLEGSEGCGKTVQAAALVAVLRQEGFNVLATREPGGTPVGDRIRSILLDRKHGEMERSTEVLLFQASRSQLVRQVIRPHLEAGGIVVCDRYADSSLAYQGYGYGLDLAQIRNLIHFATDGLTPDLSIFLDVDVEEGLQRRKSGEQINRLDTYQVEFYQRVRQGYLELIAQEPQRWVTVDAGRPLEIVGSQVQHLVLERLRR